MDDVTDTVFRQIIRDIAPPDLFFTEFVNVDGLQSPGRPKLLKKLQFVSSEAPLIAQIWGKNPENFYKTAQQLADGTFAQEIALQKGVNFAGIDLNMGCPDRTVVKNGTCSALINNRELAQEIIQATQEGAGGKLPISVKTRLGFNTVDMSWPEFLLERKLAMLTIHGRTRKELSLVPADWDKIGEVRKLRDRIAPETKIVGNGDVMSRKQGISLAKKYLLDGIMVGRGIFQDPFVFAEESPWPTYTKDQKIDLFTKQIKLFAETWQDAKRPIAPLNKFSKMYLTEFDGAKEIREQLTTAQSAEELLTVLAGV